MDPLLVGRASELAALASALDATLGGRGGLVLLAGEAGIGKTAALRRFTGDAARRGALVAGGACYDAEWSPPYGPWLELLDELARLRPAGALARAAGGDAPSLVQFSPAYRRALPDVAAAAPLLAREERFRLYDAVAQMLRRTAEEQPLVLALEDLHWADPGSGELLRHVARSARAARLLLVGTWRDPEMESPGRAPYSGLAASLREEAGAIELRLRGLTLDESGELLAAGGEALPGALVQRIHHETAGNPFYAREVFQNLIEERKVVRAATGWASDFSLAELGIPASVRQAVQLRAARLSDPARTLLRFATTFAGAIDLVPIAAAAGLADATLVDALDEALRAGLLQPRPGGGYEFRHAIVRRAIRDELNADRRARLHRTMATALEALHGAGARDDPGEIAAQYHASAALPGREHGVRYALEAATRATAAAAHERAVMFLRMARELAAGAAAAVRADVLARLAVAESDALLFDEAPATVAAACSALGDETIAAAPAVAALLARCAQALKHGGAARGAWEPLVERGLALTGERHDLTWARLQLLLDRFEPIVAGPVYISRWCPCPAGAVAIARRDGDEDDQALTLDSFDCRTRAGTAEALRRLHGWSRPTAIIRALDAVARDLAFRQGDLGEAAVRLEELRVVAQRCGSIVGQAEAHVQLAVVRAALGDRAASLVHEEAAQATIARLGSVHRLQLVGRPAIRVIIGYLYGGADWRALADGYARTARNPDTGRSPLGFVTTNLATLCLVQAGAADEARPLLAALVTAIAASDATVYQQGAARDGAAVSAWELEAREHAAALERAALAPCEAGPGTMPFSLPELTVARMAALAGRMEDALAAFDRARAVAEARGLLPLRAIADHDEALARQRAGDPDRARLAALIDGALARFQALGMEPWIARIERLRVPAEAPAGLTPREAEVLRLLAGGRANKEIAADLFVSIATVERHVANVYDKIGVRGRAAATAWAIKHGLTPA